MDLTRLVVVLIAVSMFCASASGGEWRLKTTWDASRLRDEFAQKAPEMLLGFYVSDSSVNRGKGRSDSTTSGDLAWSESGYLRNYIMCYYASRDTYWLDKVVDHFDRMLSCLDDHNGDGYLAWHDVKYSVGVVSLVSRENADGLTIEPEESRIWVKRGGEAVTGHDYSIRFADGTTLEIYDETQRKLLARKAYRDGTIITEIPGSKFKLTGRGRAGAVLRFRSIKPEEIEYQVHDGMITYPIAQFIELVRSDEELRERYGAKADKYLMFIDKHVREKWERYWVDLGNGRGAYRFTENPTQRVPSEILPHNQYLALGRTYLVLKDVDGVPHRDDYLKKATMMARYFKSCLKLNDGAYLWNYWDPTSDEIRRHPEDVSHGTIDIGFVVEACNRGVVFDVEDMKRFARTYVEVMWNGSKTDPIIAGAVDGRRTKRNGRWIAEYIKLSQWDERVWRLCMLQFEKAGYPVAWVPSVLYMVAGMAGLPEGVSERFARLRSEVEGAIKRNEILDGDFERLAADSKQLLFWGFCVWSGGKGFMEITERAFRGEHAVMLKGTEQPVNLVLIPRYRLRGGAGERVRLSVQYRTEGDARPQFSLLGYDADSGERIQYDNSEPFAPSADWAKATWEVTLKDGVEEFKPVLRNYGLGAVFYDDFRLEKLGAGNAKD